MGETGISRRAVLRIFGAGTVAATGLAAAGCSSSGQDKIPSNPGDVSGDVTMWIYPIDPENEQKWWPAQVKTFNQTYPKVKVNVVVQPWANRDEQLTTAIAGGKGPDVVYLIPDQLPGYADQKTLADVADVISKDRNDFRPRALQAMTYKNTLYGVPILMGGSSTLANSKIFSACGLSGVPKTWNDLLSVGAALKPKGYYLLEYDATPDQTLNLTYYPYLWEAGGQILNSDMTKAAFNSPAGLEALNFVRTLAEKGYVPKDPLTVSSVDATNLIAAGKIGVVTDGSVNPNTPGIHLDDWKVGPPPKKKISAGYGVVGGLSVLSASKNIPAAKAWVRYVASKPHLKKFDKQRRYFSPRKSLSNLFTGDPLLGEQEKYVDSAIPGLIHPKARQIMDLIKPEIQSAILGKKSPQAALSAAEKSVNGLLGGA